MSTEAFTRDLFAGVNAPSDPQNLTDLEKRHIPSVQAPACVQRAERFSVTVEVGKSLPHVNDRRHFIEFIELYADRFFLARIDLTAVNTHPKATLAISLSGPAKQLRAYARCNMHGVWVGASPIAVAD